MGSVATVPVIIEKLSFIANEALIQSRFCRANII